MLTLQVIEVLKKLNKKEFKRFGDFINSPYLNSIEKLSKFYEIVEKEYPDFSEEKLNYKTVYKKLFPGKEYTHKSIQNLYSEFGNILKKFLAYEQIAVNEDLIDFNLAESLMLKQSYELSKKTIADFQKRKKEDEKLSEEDLYFLYKMDKLNHVNLIHSRPINKYAILDSLNSESDNFASYFLSSYYSLAYSLSLTSIIRKDEENNVKINKFLNAFSLDKSLQYIDSKKFADSPKIRLKYLLYYYTTNDISEKEYFELKDLLLKNIPAYTPEETVIFFKGVIEIMLLKLLEIDKKYFVEAFELRKIFCDLKIYPNDSLPAFSVSSFQNSLLVAMILQEFEWAENFLTEYINYIDEDLKENEYNYSMGLLNFRLQKYEKSLEYLNNVKYSGLLEKVNVRFYYVMNYIELKSYEAASSMVKSIKQLYRLNKEIPEITLGLMQDSLKFFNEIIKCAERNEKLDLAVFKEAEKLQSYYHRPYIIKKMMTLI